jgi:hypothetical protein
MRRSITKIGVSALILLVGNGWSAIAAEKSLSDKDQAYLHQLYRDTWGGLDYFTHPISGFPLDVNSGKTATSISNIGLYMAATAIAGQTHLLNEKAAYARLDRVFSSLEKVKKWRGFPITWVRVDDGSPAYGPKFSYADHNGNLICSLLVVAGAYPKRYAARVKKFIKPMQFQITYDPKVKMIKGGFDLSRQDFDVKQPWGNWYYNLLASDTRHFGLLGMALEKIPHAYWLNLTRHTRFTDPLDQEMISHLKSEQRYFWPGMEGGGLFMQYLPAIFLDEKALPMGNSARTMAAAQIAMARADGTYPVWGISASESPDGKGYLGWGALKKNVITPHASMLAIEDFPQETLANLRVLDKNGMRPAIVQQGKKFSWGFTDAYDVRTQRCSAHYLALDQGMAFLSLANFMFKGIVRRNFIQTKLGNQTQALLFKLESTY